MSETYFKRVQSRTPTRFWINNVTRKQALLALEHGAVGCTQNPSYTWKMLSDPEERDYAYALLDEILKDERDDNAALIRLQRELVGGVARQFKPLFDATHGRQGYVSIQGDPFREDAKSIAEFARFHRQAGENIMAKIPVVESGLEAIALLAKERVPINATECMAVRQVLDVCQVYEKATRNLVNPAPLYYSVITGIFDEYLQKQVLARQIPVSSDALWQAGMAVAKKAHQMVKQQGYDCHYISGGARGLHHFTEMVGADCAVTINWNGAADLLLEQNPPVVSRFPQPVDHAVIDELVELLPDFRKAYFVRDIEPHEYEEYGPVVLFRTSFEQAWRDALAAVGQRR